MKENVLLSTSYLAPIQYYTKLLSYKKVYIEIHDNFIKQTYRNRCKIYGANGLMQLIIPVKKDQVKTKVKDIRIDYDTNWQKMHWKSIESAYRSSPFFEFYADDIMPFYEKKVKFLCDFNSEIQKTIFELMEIDVDMHFTDNFVAIEINDLDDFRESIHPKKIVHDPDFKPIEYKQVFADKHGFLKNLSIIDLLFNEGPNILNVLEC